MSIFHTKCVYTVLKIIFILTDKRFHKYNNKTIIYSFININRFVLLTLHSVFDLYNKIF